MLERAVQNVQTLFFKINPKHFKLNFHCSLTSKNFTVNILIAGFLLKATQCSNL